MRTIIIRSVRIVDRISVAGLKASTVVILLMLFVTVADVIGRNTGRPGIPTVYEFMEASLTFSVYLGAAYVQQQDGHVSAELVTDLLPEHIARAIRLFGLTIVAAVLAWASWATIQAAISSVARSEAKFGVYNFPVWPARIVVAVGMILLTLQVLISIAKIVTATETTSKDVVASEGHNL